MVILRDLPDKTTVESCLEIALREAGLISECNFGELKKNGWQRCSRTDKGVHAVYNGVNCKINIHDRYIDLPAEQIDEEFKKDDRSGLKSKIRRSEIIKLFNNYLDDNIRVYGNL